MTERRKHRRVRKSWAGCGCPEGSSKVPTPGVTRGWACSRLTARGPRFVRAVCAGAGQEPVTSGKRARKKAPSKPKRKVDWNVCKCPVGAELAVNKRGGRNCVAVVNGKRKFVGAECP